MIEIIDLLARAGGGGSGGGGGGGSSGGGGDGNSFLVFVGYLICYWPVKIVKRIFKHHIFAISLSVAIIETIALIMLLFVFNTISLVAVWLDMLVVVGVWIGWQNAYYDVFEKFSKKIKKAKTDLAFAASVDPTWNEATLHQISQNAFLRYQDDWSNFKTDKLGEYLHPSYIPKAVYMMRSLYDLHRINKVQNPEIINVDFVEITDLVGKENDSFAVLIKARSNDQLIEIGSGKVLYADKSTFSEIWHFEREGETWLVKDITQSTENKALISSSLKTFAEQNNMYFSADMGWLFLPKYGNLQSKGGFGMSDINNHVIGMWNNNLVQLYNYTSNTAANSGGQTALIGQLNVPKTYSYILIRPKPKFFSSTLTVKLKPNKNTEKYTYEWPEFNRRFEVFAAEQDRLASFELLNPGFMAFMYDIDERIGIEVVDNIIYFIAPASLTAEKYGKMLELLTRAYKELKL